MADREKVINDLMLAIRFVESRGYGGVGNVMRDAIELLTPKWPLKEDAPRVLTLEEMLYSDKELICEFRYGIEPQKFKPEDRIRFVIDGRVYGKTWRCWTSKPTDEQREATAWQ